MAKLTVKPPPDKKAALARRIYKLQNEIVRELNNAHIFLEQALPLLQNAKKQYEKSKNKDERRYYVPSVDRIKFAVRTDRELKSIYDSYLDQGLCEAFLVSSISQFENFLGDILALVLKAYPQKLTIRSQEIPVCPSVSAADIVAAENKDALLAAVVREHLSNVFRQRPKFYMTYLSAVVGCELDPSFLGYYEVAATRDLVVHNSCTVNQLYIEKAGAKKRGKVGDRLAIDTQYLYSALAQMKKVSGAIKRDVELNFGAKAKEIAKSKP